MPVFSYLAIAEPGELEALQSELNSIEYCEAIPSDNKEILVLVTDTPDEPAERDLQKKFKEIKSLQSLSMTFGHVDEEKVSETEG
jgi:nitrate reductase NapAB chaperone NapD